MLVQILHECGSKLHSAHNCFFICFYVVAPFPIWILFATVLSETEGIAAGKLEAFDDTSKQFDAASSCRSESFSFRDRGQTPQTRCILLKI